MFENAQVVKVGTWLYDNKVPCKVKIIKWNILYGSGDYEDAPEIRDDLDAECYYILYNSPTDVDAYSRGKGFISLDDAISDIENSPYLNVVWD